METTLSNGSTELRIRPDGPLTIIGEKINPTGRKKLAAAIEARNYESIVELAKRQVEAGADVLDINVGVPGIDEPAVMPEVVRVVSDATDVPLCLDSANAAALAAALAITPGKPLVNSVNGEERSLESILPLIKEHGAAVIGLTMDDDGIPDSADGRLAIAERIIERCAKMGIPVEDIIIDPLVLTVGADHNAGRVTLETIERLAKEFGVNINLGASNVSFGLPERDVINAAFLALAAARGASCMITDPIKHSLTIRAIDLLLGRDAYAGRYIKQYRTLQPEK
ncbi:MAG TPA: pterin-binding protein [Chloroflexi bacterium]|nr:pterin-binding protein [Chloroflexota bacterium]